MCWWSDNDNVVDKRSVTVGRREDDDMRVIEKGIDP